MTEPTKAAMERVFALEAKATTPSNDSYAACLRAFALELDRVDRIAREAVERSIKRGDPPNERTGLVSLMLPGETDLLVTIFVESRGLDDCCDSAEALRQAADRLGLVIAVRRKGEEG